MSSTDGLTQTAGFASVTNIVSGSTAEEDKQQPDGTLSGLPATQAATAGGNPKSLQPILVWLKRCIDESTRSSNYEKIVRVPLSGLLAVEFALAQVEETIDRYPKCHAAESLKNLMSALKKWHGGVGQQLMRTIDWDRWWAWMYLLGLEDWMSQESVMRAQTLQLWVEGWMTERDLTRNSEFKFTKENVFKKKLIQVMKWTEEEFSQWKEWQKTSSPNLEYPDDYIEAEILWFYMWGDNDIDIDEKRLRQVGLNIWSQKPW